jgi:c-di-GMP-binding flagellar brake protein YcgR
VGPTFTYIYKPIPSRGFSGGVFWGQLMNHNKIEKENYRVIREAIQSKTKVIAWSLPNNLFISNFVNLTFFDSEKEEISLTPIKGGNNDLAKMISGFGRINIYLPEESVAFVSKIKSLTKDGKITLGLPLFSQFFERRAQERTDLDSTIRAEFMVEEVSYRKELLDISPGGFSLVFLKNEKIKYSEEIIIENINLKFKGSSSQITVDGKIVKILKISPFSLDKCPYGGFRVSFQFIDLGDKERGILEKYLNDN